MKMSSLTNIQGFSVIVVILTILNNYVHM